MQLVSLGVTRRDLLKHLQDNGCQLLREGGEHSIYWRPAGGQSASVPRHNEIARFTARRICDVQEIPRPKGP